MDKLLPCPFCGSESIFVNSENVGMEYREAYWGECADCGARDMLVENESVENERYAIEEVIKVWNTRTPDPRLVEVVEEINEIRGDCNNDFEAGWVAAISEALYAIYKHIPELEDK